MTQRRLCLTCSTPFDVPPGSSRKYCSVACWPRENIHSRRPRPDITIECAHCGQTFERKAWIAEKQMRLGRAQYCSVDCRDDAKRGRRGEQRVERLTLECIRCGKPFDVLPHQRHRKTCSHRCAATGGGRTAGRGKDRYITPDGYVLVYVAPEQRPIGQEKKAHHREHRVVMAEMLGRWPDAHETVHHINGDKADNRPENLQLRSGRHGKGSALRCRVCGSGDIEHVKL